MVKRFTGFLIRPIIAILVFCFSFATAVEHNESDPRATYRQIYSLIVSAEQKANAGNLQLAEAEYQEVINRLDRLKNQSPDWEPDLINFRLEYSQAQLKLIKAQQVIQSQLSDKRRNTESLGRIEPPRNSILAANPKPKSITSEDNSFVGPKVPAPAPRVAEEPKAEPQSIAQKPAESKFAPLSSDQALALMKEPIVPSTMGMSSVSNEEAAAFQGIAKQLEVRIVRLLDENRRLRSALVISENRATVAEERIQQIETLNAAAAKRINDDQDQMGLMDQKIAQAELRASTSMNRVTEMERRISEAQTSIQEAENRALEAEKRTKEMQRLLTGAQELANDLQARLTETERRLGLIQESGEVAKSRAVEAEKLANELQGRTATAEKRSSEAEAKAKELEQRALESENRAAVSAGYAKILQKNTDMVRQQAVSELRAREARQITLQDEIEKQRTKLEDMNRKIDDALQDSQDTLKTTNPPAAKSAPIPTNNVTPALTEPLPAPAPAPRVETKRSWKLSQEERALIDELLTNQSGKDKE